MWSNQAAVAAERDEAITKDLLRHRDPARAGGEEASGRGEEEAAGPPWQRHERRRCRAAQSNGGSDWVARRPPHRATSARRGVEARRRMGKNASGVSPADDEIGRAHV